MLRRYSEGTLISDQEEALATRWQFCVPTPKLHKHGYRSLDLPQIIGSSTIPGACRGRRSETLHPRTVNFSRNTDRGHNMAHTCSKAELKHAVTSCSSCAS